MREIKFRAWDGLRKQMCSTKKWVDWRFNNGVLRAFNYGYDSKEQELVIMQYTGLNDKNGLEIYEGDVVYLSGYGNYECSFPFTELYDAVMENDVGSIIGNVYENPELLEAEIRRLNDGRFI